MAMNRRIVKWDIVITWDDGVKETLDYVPNSKDIERYLDEIELEFNE